MTCKEIFHAASYSERVFRFCSGIVFQDFLSHGSHFSCSKYRIITPMVARFMMRRVLFVKSPPNIGKQPVVEHDDAWRIDLARHLQ